jgi:AcrR family transcriptional regulator
MGRKRGFDETTVLDVVRDRFWTTGFDGTSTYDLMDATGLGKGSIYKAFGNKHALYVRVFSDYCQGIVAEAREELREGPHAVLTSPMARLEHYVVSLADAFATESPRTAPERTTWWRARPVAPSRISPAPSRPRYATPRTREKWPSMPTPRPWDICC